MSRVSIPFIQTSLKMSDNERSKLTGIEKDIHGQSSIRLKCLINNLASKVNTKYLEVGVYKSLEEISKKWSLDKKFAPKIQNKDRNTILKGWKVAIKRTLIN